MPSECANQKNTRSSSTRFSGGKPHTITTLNRPIENFPSVSPDGRDLLYSTGDDPVYEIMLVDNFR